MQHAGYCANCGDEVKFVRVAVATWIPVEPAPIPPYKLDGLLLLETDDANAVPLDELRVVQLHKCSAEVSERETESQRREPLSDVVDEGVGPSRAAQPTIKENNSETFRPVKMLTSVTRNGHAA